MPENAAAKTIAITEAGKVLRKTLKQQVKAALDALQAVYDASGGEEDKQESLRAAASAMRRDLALAEAELSHDATRQAIRAALKARHPGGYIYIRDVYDTAVVYEVETYDYEYPGTLYRADYTVDDAGVATVGDPVEVRIAYEPVVPPVAQPIAASAAESRPGLLQRPDAERSLVGQIVPLVEGAVRRDGTFPIKIIQPGWGASGYYSPEVLERDGPKVFAKGTHMFLDHPTVTETAERPERSVTQLGGVLESDARWDPNGPDGPGLYADAKPLNGFDQHLESVAPHIGVSIRASGYATQGEAEGQTGPIIEQLTAGHSVDFVTRAGAGGKVLQLLEAARGEARIPASGTTAQEAEVANGNTEELTRLQESISRMEAELAESRAERMRAGARERVTLKLTAVEGLPAIAKARIVEAVTASPPVKDGALDTEALDTAITTAVESESRYLASLGESGVIRGMGSITPPEPAQIDEALAARGAAAFQTLGLSEAGAKVAAGRVN